MITSSADIAKQYIAASKAEAKKALRSKRAAVAYLIRAGILTKDGKRLAKPYR